MNPDGMVALLNYREDGTTRKYRLVGRWISLISAQHTLFSGRMVSRRSSCKLVDICSSFPYILRLLGGYCPVDIITCYLIVTLSLTS
jgi:hypothetical protein